MMGIPNIDLYLVSLLASFLTMMQGRGNDALDDLFSGHAPSEVTAIKNYLIAREISTDIRKQEENQQYIYLVDNYPMADMPFPQICVTVGNETSAEHFLGDESGERKNLMGPDGSVIAVDLENVILSSGSWGIDIIAATKREVVWLSRICQLAILSNLTQLDEIGLVEVDLSLADMRIDPQFFPQPVPARRLTLSGKVRQSWNVRFGTACYQIGENLATLDGL